MSTHPFLVALVTWSVASSAAAQERPVLVLPVAVEAGADPAAEAARGEAIATRVASGELRAVSLASAVQRFEELGSAEPPSVSQSDIERWLALSRDAVRHLARADYAAARESLLEAQSLSDQAAEELNRELARARQVLDTCLYEVRALLETHDPRAETRALACRTLVPRVQASSFNHTPEVIELLAAIDRHLAEQPPGSLRLESTPASCAVRLNGIEFGRTPFVSDELAAGEYRAQVECDAARRGRVHRLRVGGEGATHVVIDARFDSVVRTDGSLRLEYDAPPSLAQRIADALRIAAVVGASEVWLSSVEDGVQHLDRIDAPSTRVLASVAFDDGEIDGAIAALVAGRSEERREQRVVSIAPRAARGFVARDTVTTADHAIDVADVGVGSALAISALGAWGASIGLAFWRSEAGDVVARTELGEVGYVERLARWRDRRAPTWIAAWGAGALATASLPFLLPEEDGVPWWSWVSLGVGAAVVGGGVAWIGTASPCSPGAPQTRACVDADEAIDAGGALTSVGLPFLAVPVVYALRSAFGEGAPVVDAEVDERGASVSVGGHF